MRPVVFRQGLTLGAVVCLASVVTARCRADFNVIAQPSGSYLSSTTKIPITVGDGAALGSIADSNLTVTFSTAMVAATVPDSWATWSSPPYSESATPRVLTTGGASQVVLTFSKPVQTFGIEAEPDPYEVRPITATFYNGSAVVGTINLNVNGQSGARLFAGATTSSAFTSVSVTSDTDFAIAQVRYRSASIVSVQIEAINSPLDANPNAGGGLRIFPDRQFPADTADRRIVRIRAITTLPEGTAVFFRSYDVDDPSSKTAPIDPNDGSGPAGDDNRGTPHLGVLSAASATTDADGVAIVRFTVTTQPGDNFRIVASADSSYLAGVSEVKGVLKDAKGKPLPTSTAVASDMLTVWRHVHVEVDSMAAVTGNSVAGVVTSGSYNILTGRTELVLDKGLETGRFETGSIVIESIGRKTVVAQSGSSVFVKGKMPSPAGKKFTLYDDDDMNDNDGANLHGDQGEVVPGPDTSWIADSDDPIANVFAIAYVRPIYDIGGGIGSAPFTLNSTQAGLVSNYRFDNIGTESDPMFWTVYLLGCYQFETTQDGDPNSEGAVLGIVDDINGIGANIFTEVLRPKELRITGVVNAAATVAHEVGHLFGGLHSDLGLMEQSTTRTKKVFAPVTIARIRGLLHP